MGCWAGVAAFPLQCERCSWTGEKKQETRNKKREEKKGSHRSVSLVCLAEGSQRREIEREEHPDLPTDTVPPDSPATYITYLGGSTGS